MAKVSIIVPTYNVEQYLVECLESIVNQTLQDIEIICVNDGSTDNSLKIIQEYASKDLRFKIIDKPNSGYGNAMNIGLDNATGEYIGIVEPDDYIRLDMYEILYNKAKEHNLDMIKADFYRFKGSGENIELLYGKLDPSNSYYNRVINPGEDIKLFSLQMYTWSGIYRREFIEEHHIRHNETPGASFQDNGFWFQTFMYANKAYFLDRPFYMYRCDNPNSSVKSKEKVYCMKHEYDYIRSIINSNLEKLKKFIPIYWIRKFHNYFGTYYRIDESFRDEFLEVFSSEFREGIKSGEIDLDLFSKNGKRILLKIVKNPKKFRKERIHNLSWLEEIFSLKRQNGVKYLTIFSYSFPI